MIKELHLKTVFWLAVATWAVTLAIAGEPIGVALLKPSGIVFGVVTAVTALFERYMWRWRVLRPWFVSKPDLVGSYSGKLASNFIDGSTGSSIQPIDAFLSIHQTLSGITVRLMTAQSASVSLCASLVESPDGHWDLLATYRNEPRLSLQEQSRIHHGALRLEVHGQGASELIGNYFTDRDTHGEITFTRISKGRSSSFQEAQRIAIGQASPTALPRD
jgi:hypothetical protein